MACCTFFLLIMQASCMYYWWYMRRRGGQFIPRGPYRYLREERVQVVNRLFRDSDRVCHKNLRMNRRAFYRLCAQLRTYGLMDSRHIKVDEQVALFLMIIGQDWRNSNIVFQFLRSGQTISHYFHTVLGMVVRLFNDVVSQPRGENGPIDGGPDPGWHHYFKDAVGAIGGTHIHVNAPLDQQARYRNRKGEITQNVLVGVTFGMKFTYILAGWEGSAHDGHVLRSAISRNGSRLTLPQGKYYLADAGYANVTGFMTPYRGVRYHLKEHHGRRPETPKELFNLRHSSLRNVVERSIGVLKKRWAYFRHPTFHDVETQAKIVLACCALHNFLQCVDSEDDVENEESDSDEDEEDEETDVPVEVANYEQLVIATTPQWSFKRDALAAQMWVEYATHH